MRIRENINSGWLFDKGMTGNGIPVDLPHCYNGFDGQDGGDDYYRGKCSYTRKIDLKSLPVCDKYYLEINGANSTAEVAVNGQLLAVHRGGYSTFRVPLPEGVAF